MPRRRGTVMVDGRKKGRMLLPWIVTGLYHSSVCLGLRAASQKMDHITGPHMSHLRMTARHYYFLPSSCG